MKLRALSLLFAMITLSTPASADKTTSMLDPFLAGVTRYELPNGLTVLIKPEPGTGVVAIDTIVKAGYFNEPDEVAGMAHLFEHMFFKGSKKFPGASQISTELGRVGGQTNAGTIYDTTNYYFVLPSESFERGLEIQADAIANPLFNPEELDKESEVVIEESNRKKDNASAMAMENMFATSFNEHRIRRWRIGSDEVLRSINRDNLIAFFKTLYVPENIILSIAGDVDLTTAKKAVAETFGTIPRGDLRKTSGPAEPEQKEFRFGRGSADIQQGYTSMGWHTIPVGHDDELALDVLGSILGAGRSSRFFRNVVGPDAASTASAFNWSTPETGIFVVSASFDEPNREKVETNLIREIERMKKFGPTDYELAMARTGAESGAVMQLQTVLGQARGLASAEANGGYMTLGERLADLQKITPAKIKEVANRYLELDRLTLYHYQPDDAEASSKPALLASLREAAKSSDLEAEKSYDAPEIGSNLKGARTLSSAVEKKMKNGATLVVMERPGAPVISTGIYFRGGRLGENSSNAGITSLMQRAMRRGTSSRSADEINREIEFLGTQIASETEPDYFGFTLTILGKYADSGLSLLSDVILNPSFPEDGIEEERHLQSASIQRSFDSSFQRPIQLLLESFYGNHPYGLPSSGYVSSIETLDRDDLVEWRDLWVRADDALIVIAGDVQESEATKLAERFFGGLSKRDSSIELPDIPKWTPPTTRVETIERRDRKQSAIAIAFPGVTMDHEDWPSLRLLQNVTSGLGGTFFNELRSKKSLAYTVFARETTNNSAGAFYGYLASDAKKENEAVKALIAEFRRLDEDGITEEDVERAKAYFAGSTRISLQTHSSHVGFLADVWMHDLGLDFLDDLLERVAAISHDDLKDVASRYFEGSNYTTAILSGNE